MSIIVSFMGAIGTFALAIPPGINLVAVFLMAFPSGYALNDVANRGINMVQGITAKNASDATTKQSRQTTQRWLSQNDKNQRRHSVSLTRNAVVAIVLILSYWLLPPLPSPTLFCRLRENLGLVVESLLSD